MPTQSHLPKSVVLVAGGTLYEPLNSLYRCMVLQLGKVQTSNWNQGGVNTVLFCDDRWESSPSNLLERQVRKEGKTFIRILICGSEVVVGPISHDGNGCTRCFSSRVAVRRNDSALTAELNAWMAEDAGPLFSGISKVLICEAVQIAVGASLQTQLPNMVWRFDHGTQLWQESTFLSLWNCPLCIEEKNRSIEELANSLGHLTMQEIQP